MKRHPTLLTILIFFSITADSNDQKKLVINHDAAPSKLISHTLKNNLQLIDLTHSINENIPTWNGCCGFMLHTVVDYADCAGQDKFRVQTLEAKAGIGTHIDTPSHCIPGSLNIADLPLESLCAPCAMINVAQKAHAEYQVTVEDIEDFEKNVGLIAPGTFVIIYTGWSQHWPDTEKYRNELVFPSLSISAAQKLLEREIVGIGIDTLSPDCPANGFPVHRLLLGAGKYIVENIAHADSLPSKGAYTFVLPLKLEKGTEAPVRLIGCYSAEE